MGIKKKQGKRGEREKRKGFGKEWQTRGEDWDRMGCEEQSRDRGEKGGIGKGIEREMKGREREMGGHRRRGDKEGTKRGRRE